MPKRSDIRKILIIGSGPVVIGQAGEYDYSGMQACKALQELGYEIVPVDSNPATVMTDPDRAGSTYIEPLDVASIEKIIEQEHPDALLPNVGGQTALNLCTQLSEKGVLEKFGVRILGVPADSIKRSEDRQLFKTTAIQLGIPTPVGDTASSLEEAEEILKRIDLPCSIRPSYTLGGTGGGLVYNLDEFRTVVSRGLACSLSGRVLIEESVEGWEELELETVRDDKGRKITVCGFENIDAMGIHTGDSFCTVPMLTIAPELQQKMQEYAYALVEDLKIAGCADIQFAHNPQDGRIVAIEINPRASRSSALASKVTGFPVARVSALLAAGLTLDEISCRRSGSLDRYTPPEGQVAVKSARWTFEKFPLAEDKLGAQMQAVGEVVGIGKNFKEALQKSIRSLDIGMHGLGFAKGYNGKSLQELLGMLWRPTSDRIFILYEALRKGADIGELYERTRIKPWFIGQMKELVDLDKRISSCKGLEIPDTLILEAKKVGFSDPYLAALLEVSEERIRSRRNELGIQHAWEAVPSSGEKAANCYFSTYDASVDVGDAETGAGKKVLIIGPGPTRIGQGIEFDYCCVHASRTLQDLGYASVMVNCNPETISTDSDLSDRLYVSPLTTEDILSVYEKERPEGAIVQFGGKTATDICRELERAGIPVLGTSSDTLTISEDRDRFYALMKKLDIPHPASEVAYNFEEAKNAAGNIGYPLVLRIPRTPGYTGMEIVHDQEDLSVAFERVAGPVSGRSVQIYKFLEDALEVEANAVSDGVDVFIPAIMEHIELTGVHSGDSACVLPPVSVDERHRATIHAYTKKIATELKIVGLVNIQYAIAGDTVYMIGVTPRASRTVPLVSKACNVPLVRMATQVMAGAKLSKMPIPEGRTTHFGVKEAVFPFNMFHDVDPVLGPEMHSTGEVLGIADSFELAFYKSQEAAREKLPKEGTVLISISDPDKKEALEAAREFARMGFKILATEGTRRFLSDNDIDCSGILKISEGRPNIVDAIMNGDIHLVINSPIGKRGTSDDSYIRKAAIKYNVAHITTMAAAKAAAKGIAAFRRKDFQVVPLQKYHSGR